MPKAKFVTTAPVAAWDAKDRVAHVVIDDPLTRTYDPKSFVGTKVGDTVFTETDAQPPSGHR